MLVDDPQDTHSRIAHIATIAGIPCDDPAAIADKIRETSGIINLSVIPDAALADRLRALQVKAPDGPTILYPEINRNIADPEVRNALGTLDLSKVDPARRMSVLSQVTRMVREKREPEAETSAKLVGNADPSALTDVQGEEKLRLWRAGKKALVEHQNLVASFGRLRDPTARATAQTTLARLAETARRGGFEVT